MFHHKVNGEEYNRITYVTSQEENRPPPDTNGYIPGNQANAEQGRCS